MTQEELAKKKPLKEFRIGGVRATIWENSHTSKDGKTFNQRTATIERRYKSGEEWKTTNSYDASDLQKLRLTLHDAEVFLLSSGDE